MRARITAILAALAVWALAAAAASADTTITVTTTSDGGSKGQCTLRAAIEFASGSPNPTCTPSYAPSGTTTIELPTGVYELAQQPATLLVQSAAGPVVITSDGSGPVEIKPQKGSFGPLFEIASGTTATLDGVEVTGGENTGSCTSGPCSGASGGGIVNDGVLTLDQVSVIGNIAGPAVGCTGSCPGAAGQPSGGGGGIYNTGRLDVQFSTISYNSTQS